MCFRCIIAEQSFYDHWAEAMAASLNISPQHLREMSKLNSDEAALAQRVDVTMTKHPELPREETLALMRATVKFHAALADKMEKLMEEQDKKVEEFERSVTGSVIGMSTKRPD